MAQHQPLQRITSVEMVSEIIYPLPYTDAKECKEKKNSVAQAHSSQLPQPHCRHVHLVASLQLYMEEVGGSLLVDH